MNSKSHDFKVNSKSGAGIYQSITFLDEARRSRFPEFGESKMDLILPVGHRHGT